MQIQHIIEILNKTNAKSVTLLCHHNADPDAICSAFAFSRLLLKLKPDLKVDIAAAQGPSRLTKHLLRGIPVTLTAHPHLKETDLIVILDTNTIQQLGEWSENIRSLKKPIIVIDHHAAHPETEKIATLCVTDENASSTCEIVYRFFKEAGVNLTEIEAKALFLGIAFDTRHFTIASSTTFKTVADLIDAGVNAQEALSLLSIPMDFSEKIARLKACQRVKLFKVNNWIIAMSYVSAYQASAARALIELGVDLAIVTGQKNSELQISLRSSRRFYEETGIHLGRDIAKPLGESLGGMGGGHSTSAGVNAFGDVNLGFKKFMEILKDKMKNFSWSEL